MIAAVRSDFVMIAAVRSASAQTTDAKASAQTPDSMASAQASDAMASEQTPFAMASARTTNASAAKAEAERVERERKWIGPDAPSVEARASDIFETHIPGYDMRRLMLARDPLAGQGPSGRVSGLHARSGSGRASPPC